MTAAREGIAVITSQETGKRVKVVTRRALQPGRADTGTRPAGGGQSGAAGGSTDLRTAAPYGSAARGYYDRGFDPLPLPLREKFPPPKGCTGRDAPHLSAGDVHAFRQQSPASNIALRMPPEMIGLDVDAYDGKRGGETLADLEERWGPLPATVRSTSRHDGISGIRLYRVPEGLAWPGEAGSGIELITAGHRYVMAPPSIHPEGGRYRFLDENSEPVDHRDVHAEDLPQLPAAWIEGLTEAKSPPVNRRKPSAPPTHSDWLDSLDTGPMDAGLQRLVAEAVSALCGERGSRHDAACRSVWHLVNLGQQGTPGVPEALKTLRRVFIDAVAEDRGGRRAARAEWDRMLADAVAKVTADDPWTDAPAPLQSRTQDLPPFPVDTLPAAVADMVSGVSEFTQTPEDLAGVLALGVVSASVGGRILVAPRPGWREPVNLYLLPVMQSGTRKSPVFSTMTEPLVDAEHDLVERKREEITEAEARRKVAERRAEHATNAAGKTLPADDEQELEEAAVAAALAVEASTVPVRPRVLADNITPEAAASQLAEQDGHLAIMSPEGGIFDILAGRYSKGVADLDVFLKAHSGDPIRVDRKGRPPEYVQNPALTMVLTLQPSVLRAIGRNDSFDGRGLLARNLYSIPSDNVGYRKVGNPPVDPDVSNAYHALIRRLVEVPSTSAAPRVLSLTPAANRLLLSYEADTEERLRPLGDLRCIQHWASKRVGTCLRLAALLHIAGEPECASEAIGAECFKAAIRLTNYFTAHALVAFETMAVDPRIHKAELVMDYLERCKLATFSVRDLYSALPHTANRFPRVEDLRTALDVLVDHGWLRQLLTTPSGRSGRPPSRRYQTHPSLTSAQSAEQQ